MRAVAGCAKPIVSAVGHETDVTLCDLAADLRAPTPSAAAECVVPVRSELVAQIESMRRALDDAVRMQIDQKQTLLNMMQLRLQSFAPKNRITREEEKLHQLRRMLLQGMQNRFLQSEALLERYRRELELVSPYRVLSRGYAIVEKRGVPVRSKAMLASGDHVVLRFADGSAHAVMADQPEEQK